MQLVTCIRLFRHPYTICYISEGYCVLSDQQYYTSLGLNVGDCCELKIGSGDGDVKRTRLKLTTSALFLQPFVKECINSKVYRVNVMKHLNEFSGHSNKGTIFLKLILEPPDREIIDYAWSERILRLVWSRVEIENAFSWLSTLGGAYSALGDYFEHCADEAGRISIRQLKLSKMLGDESLAARSRLYSALSHSQRGRLKLSRHIVRNVAAFARETNDKRLLRMCQGVWAKLKYLRAINKKSYHKKNDDINSGNGKIINVM